jgi:lipid II:glycine glycyltransferase (peptidoglycan interpeptide bridge formation enzyme)
MQIIKNLHNLGNEALFEFIKSNSGSTIYHDPRFLLVSSRTHGIEPLLFVIQDEDKNITTYCPGVLFSEFGGIRKRLTRRAIFSGGPLMKDTETLSLLLKEINHTLKNRAIYTVINQINSFDNYKSIYSLNGFTWEPHLNFQIDLSQGEENIWKNIQATRRKQIRRGYKRGVNAEVVQDISEIGPYYSLLLDTYNRVGLPLIDSKYFENTIELFSKTKQVTIVRVLKDEKLIATRIALIHNDILYDWYAGSDPQYHDLYPNDVAVWEALKWGAQSRLRVFDFGGAGQANKEYGVRDFKQKFGGKLVHTDVFIRINKPIIYGLIKAAVKLKQLLRQLRFS